MTQSAVRKPAVVGLFYPAQKRDLRLQIQSLFKKVKSQKQAGRLRILIVPHAGYEYSGLVAGFGFRQLAGRDYGKVVLIGASHSTYFYGGLIDENDRWATPLGQVKIDKSLARGIASGVKGVAFSASAHSQEHSLEVELPFLQVVLKEFTFAPLLLGETNEEFLETAAKFLAKNINEKTIVVVSTDLSHYPTAEIANKVDKKTIKSILAGDPENFEKTVARQMVEGNANLVTCVCGERAVKLGMKLAKKLGQGEWQLFHYANSGAIGDSGRVVGYAALGWYQ